QDALNAAQVALEHEQRLSSLGGLAAAAAHELGTPLATIAVTAKELSHDLKPGSPMAEDVELILEQTGRCREILMELSRQPETEGGEPYSRLPLSTMLAEAARPYLTATVNLTYDFRPVGEALGSPEPVLTRSPEFLRAVGTLIQNATQFAEAEVILRARWDDETVTVEIIDDGPGFSAHLLDRLGEPYVSTRAGADGEGEHMGLGVFIAQNLLNRTGATLRFANQDWWDWWGAGAIVRITWPRRELEHATSETGRVGEHAGQ
ncbi:MAG: HAMP domain-containing histidine kinase, partial [Rhodospirillaceae bacterium]|nr:HAMP domain-containing histidine kinase [Rhodospirillaceae bacterium]